MCLPCFPWTWTQYDDPLDSMPPHSIWVHDGTSWVLKELVGFWHEAALFLELLLLLRFYALLPRSMLARWAAGGVRRAAACGGSLATSSCRTPPPPPGARE